MCHPKNDNVTSQFLGENKVTHTQHNIFLTSLSVLLDKSTAATEKGKMMVDQEVPQQHTEPVPVPIVEFQDSEAANSVQIFPAVGRSIICKYCTPKEMLMVTTEKLPATVSMSQILGVLNSKSMFVANQSMIALKQAWFTKALAYYLHPNLFYFTVTTNIPVGSRQEEILADALKDDPSLINETYHPTEHDCSVVMFKITIHAEPFLSEKNLRDYQGPCFSNFYAKELGQALVNLRIRDHIGNDEKFLFDPSRMGHHMISELCRLADIIDPKKSARRKLSFSEDEVSSSNDPPGRVLGSLRSLIATLLCRGSTAPTPDTVPTTPDLPRATSPRVSPLQPTQRSSTRKTRRPKLPRHFRRLQIPRSPTPRRLECPDDISSSSKSLDVHVTQQQGSRQKRQ